MARFRKLLVHGFEEVEDERVCDIPQADLADLDTYLSDVARAVGER